MTSYVLCKTGSLAVFKVTARDQGHYKGPSGAFVTYCNISCFFFVTALIDDSYIGNKRTWLFQPRHRIQTLCMFVIPLSLEKQLVFSGAGKQYRLMRLCLVV